MIDNCLKLLFEFEYLGESEIIDIAKGKYELPKTWGDFKNKAKRKNAWLLLKK